MPSTREDRWAEEEQIAAFLRGHAQEAQLGNVRRRNRSISVAAARDSLFLEQLEDVASRVFAGKFTPPRYALKKHAGEKDRVLNAILSDTHFHSMLESREHPLKYGPLEEARRLAKVALQAVEYKSQYRDTTRLFLHIIGDMFNGSLHDLRDGAPLSEQVCATVYLLSQFIQFVAGHFPEVVVRCATGNHGRWKIRHPDRAVHQKWDSLETVVYYAVKQAVAAIPNVTVEIPQTPYYTFQVFDKRGFATHGDTVLNPGYPGKNIDVAGVRRQINEYNGGRHGEPCDLFMVGHVHTGSIVPLPNGAIFMSNGCLIPPDSFALSIGCFDTACGQWLFESTPGHIVGDSRFVEVNAETDADSTLDAVIKPFEGF